MGGADPPYGASPRRRSPRVSLDLHESHILWGQSPEGATPSGGVSGVVPPQMAPPNLGIAGIRWGVLPGRYSTDFHRFILDFLGRLFLVACYRCLPIFRTFLGEYSYENL